MVCILVIFELQMDWTLGIEEGPVMRPAVTSSVRDVEIDACLWRSLLSRQAHRMRRSGRFGCEDVHSDLLHAVVLLRKSKAQ